LRRGDTACGDYDKDGVNELIVKKKHRRRFEAYVWNSGTKKWDFEAEYVRDDLIVGHSEIAMGNVRGTETIVVDPDDRPDSDGDGVDDCGFVSVTGSFDGWSGWGAELTDDDGDGTFIGLFTGITPGVWEYKYTCGDLFQKGDYLGVPSLQCLFVYKVEGYPCFVPDEAGYVPHEPYGLIVFGHEKELVHAEHGIKGDVSSGVPSLVNPPVVFKV